MVRHVKPRVKHLHGLRVDVKFTNFTFSVKSYPCYDIYKEEQVD